MIYLDNSATTKQYDEVTEIMVEAMKNGFGNPSSLYQLGLDAEKTIKAARSRVLRAAFGETGKGGTGDYDLVFTSGEPRLTTWQSSAQPDYCKGRADR